MHTDESLNVLIAGCGSITQYMAPYLAARPWFQSAGLVDVRDQALAQTGTKLGVPPERQYKDLAVALAHSGADTILLNTPSDGHYAQCQAALAAGLHVLVAKPVTNNYEEAVSLVSEAATRGLTFAVAQQIRYNRHFEAVRRFMASGALGRVEAAWFMNSKPRPNPANLATMAQPALYEMACHHFDALLAVFGEAQPEWVACDGFTPSWSPYAGPSMVNALIRFNGGLHLSYHGGFASQAPMYEFRVEGTHGALRCHGLHMSNDTMHYEFAPALGQFSPVEIDADVPLQDPFVPFLDAWYAYRRGGVEPPFSGRNNLQVFAMLSAAIDSVTSGQPVRIADNPRYTAAFSAKGAV
ncbi:MAG: Gfo/Idh/MocA family protein [Armatimonadota bacterium]